MKRKFFSLILAGLMVVSLLGCASSNSGTNSEAPTQEIEKEEFDLTAYKALVSACRADINAAGTMVANVGKYENSYWTAMNNVNGRVDSDKMVESAFSWFSENSDESRETVDAAYESIRQQYKDIALIEIEGKEAEEIDSAFRNMYDAYSSLYSIVTSPSGDRSNFVTSYNEYVGTITDSDEDLALFLDE